MKIVSHPPCRLKKTSPKKWLPNSLGIWLPSPYLTCQGIDFNVADGLVTQFFIKNIGAGNV